MSKLDERWLREGARDEAEYAGFLARRAAGEPVHRILGWREFWGLKFFLSPDTLEPRPDSETVIEVLKSLSPGAQREGERLGEGVVPKEQTSLLRHVPLSRPLPLSVATLLPGERRFLDLGTGTGCLLLAALHEFPGARGVGVDIAAGAVTTAQKNAAENHLSARAAFEIADWNNPDDMEKLKSLGPFDVVLCNPPYIASDEIPNLQTEVRAHDPMRALDGGADGLAPYRILALQLKDLLAPSGIAIFEIGHDQAAAVRTIMQSQNLSASAPRQDLGGNDRVMIVRRA